jgi:mevalonate kinase
MEVTNDRIMGALKLQIPLRAYISGSSDMLVKGKPAIAIAINRYTKGLIQVYEIANTVIKKEIRFIIRSANQIVVDYTIKSMWEVLDLNLGDMKEVKLIKHVLRNEPRLQNEVKAMFREQTTHF